MDNKKITFIIPTFKEQIQVVQSTLAEINQTMSALDWSYDIIVVNDGSGAEFDYGPLSQLNGVMVVNHQNNRGYGAAIKSAILHTQSPWLAITDADGTYPNQDFPRLLGQTSQADMVVGVRKLSDVPWLRRLPKFVLNRYASFLSNNSIADLNTGMRVFKRDLAIRFWNLFPDGFSLTSTLTMASLGHGYTIKDVPIDYYKRTGKSSIKPIQDTIRFFKMVGRLGLYFNPLRIFSPIALVCLGVGVLKGARDYYLEGHIGTLSGSFMISGLQIFLMGLIAELISKKQ